MHWFVMNAAGAGYRIEPVKTNHLQMPKQIDSISWDNEKFPIVSDVNFARVCKHLAWLVVGAKVPWHGRLRACSLVGPPICGLYAGRTPLSKRRTNLCLPATKCKLRVFELTVRGYIWELCLHTWVVPLIFSSMSFSLLLEVYWANSFKTWVLGMAVMST